MKHWGPRSAFRGLPCVMLCTGTAPHVFGGLNPRVGPPAGEKLVYVPRSTPTDVHTISLESCENTLRIDPATWCIVMRRLSYNLFVFPLDIFLTFLWKLNNCQIVLGDSEKKLFLALHCKYATSLSIFFSSIFMC